MYRTLLLDVDGVLLRDRLLAEHMKENIVQYVQRKVPTTKDPKKLNQALYYRYGHTAKGLSHVFDVDTRDFNRHVFNKQLIDHLWYVIMGNEFQKDASIIHRMSRNHDVMLFSNAPLLWSMPVAQAIGNVTVYENEFMKPDLRAYTRLAQNKRYMFVDDTLANLKPVRTLSNWFPVHFNNSTYITNGEFPVVRDLFDVETLFNNRFVWSEHPSGFDR